MGGYIPERVNTDPGLRLRPHYNANTSEMQEKRNAFFQPRIFVIEIGKLWEPT